jgi:hypothetical protein
MSKPVKRGGDGHSNVLLYRTCAINLSFSLGRLALEVLEDTKPGGHHGAVLLAVNEWWELITLSSIVPPKLRFRLKQPMKRLALESDALIVAMVESVEEPKLGKLGGNACGHSCVDLLTLTGSEQIPFGIPELSRELPIKSMAKSSSRGRAYGFQHGLE